MLQASGSTAVLNTGAVDDSIPTSDRSLAFPSVPSHPTTTGVPRTRSPVPHASADLSRQSSRRSQTSSRGASSPALRPLSAGIRPQSEEWLLSNSARDEIAFYQAETHMLCRENQMLRMRIRELGLWKQPERTMLTLPERQIQETNSVPVNTPVTPSNLVSAPVESSEVTASSNGISVEEKS